VSLGLTGQCLTDVMLRSSKFDMMPFMPAGTHPRRSPIRGVDLS